jgi:hypothetical protein
LHCLTINGQRSCVSVRAVQNKPRFSHGICSDSSRLNVVGEVLVNLISKMNDHTCAGSMTDSDSSPSGTSAPDRKQRDCAVTIAKWFCRGRALEMESLAVPTRVSSRDSHSWALPFPFPRQVLLDSSRRRRAETTIVVTIRTSQTQR